MNQLIDSVTLVLLECDVALAGAFGIKKPIQSRLSILIFACVMPRPKLTKGTEAARAEPAFFRRPKKDQDEYVEVRLFAHLYGFHYYPDSDWALSGFPQSLYIPDSHQVFLVLILSGNREEAPLSELERCRLSWKDEEANLLRDAAFLENQNLACAKVVIPY